MGLGVLSQRFLCCTILYKQAGKNDAMTTQESFQNVITMATTYLSNIDPIMCCVIIEQIVM